MPSFRFLLASALALQHHQRSLSPLRRRPALSAVAQSRPRGGGCWIGPEWWSYAIHELILMFSFTRSSVFSSIKTVGPPIETGQCPLHGKSLRRGSSPVPLFACHGEDTVTDFTLPSLSLRLRHHHCCLPTSRARYRLAPLPPHCSPPSPPVSAGKTHFDLYAILF